MLNTLKETIGQKLGLSESRTIAPGDIQPVENLNQWAGRYTRQKFNENLSGYTFVENAHAPFTPMRRALPLLNLALISSAGAYIDGTEPFDTTSRDGDISFREIPVEVEAGDMLYAARGYDAAAVRQDRNAQIPVERLLEYEANGVIGKLNNVWWTLNGFIPNAAAVAENLAPEITGRLHRYEVQAALLVPASRLCHQTLAIIARKIEQSGIPTMMISVDKKLSEAVRPPRAAFYNGEFGSVVGKPNHKHYQLRVLDESLRWIETFDQPGIRKLVVDLETEIETERGER